MGTIGVTILAGFLGSGKTTLLRRIVRDPVIGPEVAVIVNELGALGLDEELIRSESTTPSLRTQQLTSGCLCCTLRGELLDALVELAGRAPPPRYLLIECSGAALASEISYGVNAAGFELPMGIRTDAVITLVDAHNAERAHREQPDLFEDQVRTADLVLVNKVDLVPDERDRARLLEWLRPLAPRASWLLTEQAAVAPALLLGEPASPPPELQTPTPAPPARPRSVPGHGFEALTVPMDQSFAPFDRSRLEDALDEISQGVFRIKGIVEVQRPGADAAVPVLIQVVGDRIEIEDIAAGSALWGAARRLIFIGVAVRRQQMERQIRAALKSAQA